MKVQRDGYEGVTLIPETPTDKAAITRWSKEGNSHFILFVAQSKETGDTHLSLVHKKKKSWLRIVDVLNAYEHNVMAMPPATVYGDAIDYIDRCPEGFVMIVDAEMELVAFVPRDKGKTLEALLNWAAEHYPAEARD